MDALSLCEEEEDDLPKWLQEEPDEEERIFRFALPQSFPIAALSVPLVTAPLAASPGTSTAPALEFRVMAVGRHLQHVRGVIGAFPARYTPTSRPHTRHHCDDIPQ